MITMDRDLNIDERKEKYRSREVICEKNWKHVINHYHCMDCLDEETDDKEKAHLRYGICKECSQPNTGTTGGFAKVYSANWIDGYIRGWDLETKNWKRKKQKKVALKELNGSSKDISKGFLNELKTLVKLLELNPFIVPLYGISQHPDTKNFILVFKYIDNNFHNIQGFTPSEILESRLINICISLKLIHLNNLVHRDLHLEICRDGKRPEIRAEIPLILKDLIQKCWDEIPENRPTIEEIIDVLTSEELFYKLLNLRLDLAALPSSSSDTKRLLDVPDSSELEPMPTTQIATDVVDS
ncbi:uncharacterized protein OCT59_019277 [Rhizophagus irregularis]|uniref:uncharacterized protein n=1 Tax=Rhizophagus irregularis TaxID=588596 RepID=UPI003318D3EB|nr:hypothetical protein OCT59_019277 [Rhizophagus irregularis]